MAVVEHNLTHVSLCPIPLLRLSLDMHSPPLGAGLIIDAFGELRDQQEQVKEDMEV